MAEPRLLSYKGSYICPACRHGQISELPLMDAFACNFCRHIFTADLSSQQIRIEDSSQPMVWRWNGQGWRSAASGALELTIVTWLVSLALVLLPPVLVWLSSYTFPPLPDSSWAWVPRLWLGLTSLFHLLLVLWLLVEFHQIPLYLAFKVRLQAWLRQRQS